MERNEVRMLRRGAVVSRVIFDNGAVVALISDNLALVEVWPASRKTDALVEAAREYARGWGLGR